MLLGMLTGAPLGMVGALCWFSMQAARRDERECERRERALAQARAEMARPVVEMVAPPVVQPTIVTTVPVRSELAS